MTIFAVDFQQQLHDSRLISPKDHTALHFTCSRSVTDELGILHILHSIGVTKNVDGFRWKRPQTGWSPHQLSELFDAAQLQTFFLPSV